MNEWSREKKWNPFNSYKLLAQAYRWKQIIRGECVPQPGLITVDPINRCNLNCEWCNADFLLKKNHQMMSRKTLIALADFLPKWQGTSGWQPGVEAVCIAGGGEPLLHPDIGEFINRLVGNEVEAGVVTNGTEINNLLEPLSRCSWVGVSVDAGSQETFERLKKADRFNKIINNIQQLTSFASKNDCQLGKGLSGSGVSYKFLLTPENIDDIIPAAHIAKETGCTSFHLRPAGIAWNERGALKKDLFQKKEELQLAAIIDTLRSLEDKNFGVYGITHKFGSDLNPANCFEKCHAIFMSCVIMPPRDTENENFRLGLCCDRRGDDRVEPGLAGNDVEEIAKFWGTSEHWRIFDEINVSMCPRCTCQPHNQIMEHVVLQDNMTFKFI